MSTYSTRQRRTTLFISYSHKDKEWLERLKVFLRPLERELPQLEIWEDTRIRAGSKWRTEIQSAIARAKIAILLVTADFLASDFIANDELPPLLEAAEAEGATILAVILSPCRFLRMTRLSQFQTVNDPSEPVVDMSRGAKDAVFLKITDTIEDLLMADMDARAPDTHTPAIPSEDMRLAVEEAESGLSTLEQVSQKQLQVLQGGTAEWNRWRRYNPESRPNLVGLRLTDVDLSGINLSEADLQGATFDGANLSSADLHSANLDHASLIEVDLTEANLTNASLKEANLSGASLVRADIEGADLYATSLRRADISEANVVSARLSRADLQRATLVMTNLKNADLSGCRVHGISAWNLMLNNALQQDLVITLPDEPTITVDNIEFAQVVYLLLYNDKIRDLLDTVSGKNVLLLGRFTQDRKMVLNSIRDELRRNGYIPILFDYAAPTGRNITETLTTLANMSRFIIADITDAKTIGAELMAITSSVLVPILPIIESSSVPFAMFEDLRRYSWVLNVIRYSEGKDLSDFLKEQVIAPAESKVRELAEKKRKLRGDR